MATVWMLLRPFCQDFRQFGSIGEREARPKVAAVWSDRGIWNLPGTLSKQSQV